MVLSSELGASISMKKPPKLQGEGSTASTHEHPVCNRIKGLSVLKQEHQKKTAVWQVETSLQIPWPSSVGYRGNPMPFFLMLLICYGSVSHWFFSSSFVHSSADTTSVWSFLSFGGCHPAGPFHLSLLFPLWPLLFLHCYRPHIPSDLSY